MNSLSSTYQRDGFVVLRQFLSSADIERLREECDRLCNNSLLFNASDFRVDIRATINGELVPERFDPVSDISTIITEIQGDERIVGLASELLGEYALPFKDKLIVKHPGTMGYPMHQDFSYIRDFGFSGHQQLAIAIPIDPCNSKNGAVELLPGLHHELLPGSSGNPYEIDETALDLAQMQKPDLFPGDLLVFNSLVPHRSSPNYSNTPRRVLYLTYNSISTGDLYSEYYERGKP